MGLGGWPSTTLAIEKFQYKYSARDDGSASHSFQGRERLPRMYGAGASFCYLRERAMFTPPLRSARV